MGRVRDIKCIHKQGDVIFHVLVHLSNTQDERCASPVKRLICFYGSGITHSFMNTSPISLDTVPIWCVYFPSSLFIIFSPPLASLLQKGRSVELPDGTHSLSLWLANNIGILGAKSGL